MTANYAGAVAAIEARFIAQFSAAPFQKQNADPPQAVWPPPKPGADQLPPPFAYLEVLQTSSALRGAGSPGNQTWLTLGLIQVHVFAPRGYGMSDHIAIAEAAGEVFRAATFYNTDPGAKIQCAAPAIGGGDSAADDGEYFALKVAIPFEFFFLK